MKSNLQLSRTDGSRVGPGAVQGGAASAASETFDRQGPIRLAILGTRGIPAQYGGFETFAEELSTRLTAMGGFDVTVYCPGGATAAQSATLRGVTLRYVKSPGTGSLGNILFDFWCLFACLGRHDVVYLCGYGASYLAWIPRLFGAEVWINIGGLEWKRTKWPPLVRRYAKLCEWFSARCANRVICDARALLDYFRAAYPHGAKTSFFPYGAPELPLTPRSAELLPPDLRPHAYYLLVARLEPENNVLEIVTGYSKSGSRMPLVVVGNLDSRPYVERLRREAGPNVMFLGGLYDKARLAALRRYAFAAFHGHSVGGTNPSLLEALAAGRPIIAHDNPFNREVGGPLVSSFCTPDDIPPRMADLEARSIESDLDQLEAAQRWLGERYSWESIVAEYALLLRQRVRSFA